MIGSFEQAYACTLAQARQKALVEALRGVKPPLPQWDRERRLQRLTDPEARQSNLRPGVKIERLADAHWRATALANRQPFGRAPNIGHSINDAAIPEWLAAHKHCGTVPCEDPDDTIRIGWDGDSSCRLPGASA